jgi:hypothetical protein
LRQRRQHHHKSGGVVVDHQSILGSSQLAELVSDYLLSRSTPPHRQVILQIRISSSNL